MNLNMDGLKDILRLSLMLVKSICAGNGESTVFLLPTRKGVLIDPKIYDELRIKDIEIVIWNKPLYNSDSDAYTTITLNSTSEDYAETTVAHTCLRNELEASYKIGFMKNERWRIENMEILTIS